MANPWGNGISLKGNPGDPGATIIFGHGAPASTVGNVNDVFFDQDGSYIYQKTATGWPAQGVLLQGKAGLGGANGFSFDAGPQNPQSTDGNTGDFWVNYTTGEVFGPKGSDKSWPDTGMSIKGPPGLKGDAGQRGTQTFYGQGAPTSQTITSNNAMTGDQYWDISGSAPVIYVLNIPYGQTTN